MQKITYHRPDSVDAACELLADHRHDAAVLAGGQSLIQMLKRRLVDKNHIVDIMGIDELGGITVEDDVLRVGAGVTYSEVRDHPTVGERVPVLYEALGNVGDVQIRSRGTLAGGIAHADPRGDPPVVATALDATVHVAGPNGTRDVSAPEFFREPFETDLEADELITSVEIPLPSESSYSTYRAFPPGQGNYAIASLATVLDFDGDTVTDATLVVGSVGDAPQRVEAGESVVEDDYLGEDRCEEAAEAARDQVDALGGDTGSEEYKETLVERLTRDTLTEAL